MGLSFTSSKAQLEAQPPPTHIILASQSLGRKLLLDKLGVRFRTAATRIDEDSIKGRSPLITIKKRAQAKLDEIVNNPRVYLLDETANNLVVAADSMAIIGKKTFGKPKGRKEAKKMLDGLMGKTHTFTTAVAAAFIKESGRVTKKWFKTEETKVSMRKMNKIEVETYINRYDFSRFAASYAINECPWDLITKIDGSYTNVIGLPLEVVIPIFRSLELI